MKRYLTRWFILDLMMVALPWILVSAEGWARAGGGSSGSCHGWICIVLYPIFLIYGLYASLRISLKYMTIKRALAKMAEREPQWSEENLLSISKDRFIQLQTAWSEQNIPEMERYLTSTLLSNWKMQIEQQKATHTRNVMQGISIQKIRIVSVKNFKDDSRDEFTVAIDAKANDQTMVEGRVTQENNKAFREFWTFRWNENQWKLDEVVQAEGWKRFVSSQTVDEK